MEKLDLSQLSDTQKQELMAQLQQEAHESEARIENERKAYKAMVSDTVNELIGRISKAGEALVSLKMDIFSSFDTLVQMKTELYASKSENKSHTFSNTEQTARIVIGYRVIDRYDDTVNEGIAKVRAYVDSLVRDEDSAKLVRIVNGLLRRDKEGNLRSNRVLELVKFAKEENDPLLTDGVNIIKDAYKPERSAYYVEAQIKNAAGAWIDVPLAITSAAFPKDFRVNF